VRRGASHARTEYADVMTRLLTRSVIALAVTCTLVVGTLKTGATGSQHHDVTTLELWPGAIPDAWPVSGPEYLTVVKAPLVADRPWTAIGRVSHPTLTLYRPSVRATGAAMLVFPGGGYEELAIDLEGTEVCDWLTARGIACVLVKYRVPGVDLYARGATYPKSGPYPESPLALEDAQRAMRIVRAHATQWGIAPNKIGVIGFSAGGHLVAAISNHFATSLYRPVDAIDRESARPDFAAAIYPGHLDTAAVIWDEKQRRNRAYAPSQTPEPYRELQINPDIHVTSQTPPTFLLQAQDDDEDSVDDALAYYVVLKHAHVPAEMHLYPRGGHAFGLRRTTLPITAWPNLMLSWLRSLGVG
jgi:acetyl esterase/lipase